MTSKPESDNQNEKIWGMQDMTQGGVVTAADLQYLRKLLTSLTRTQAMHELSSFTQEHPPNSSRLEVSHCCLFAHDGCC